MELDNRHVQTQLLKRNTVHRDNHSSVQKHDSNIEKS